MKDKIVLAGGTGFLGKALAWCFAEKEYDTVLLLEVDCIPLHKDSFNYMFKRAEEGVPGTRRRT